MACRSLQKVLNVKEPTSNRFYWPALDVDLTVDITDQTGRTNVFAMMEPFLPRLLGRAGIHFQRAGSDVDFRGIRAPYFITTQSALEHMEVELKELYECIRGQLYGNAAGSRPAPALRAAAL